MVMFNPFLEEGNLLENGTMCLLHNFLSEERRNVLQDTARLLKLFLNLVVLNMSFDPVVQLLVNFRDLLESPESVKLVLGLLVVWLLFLNDLDYISNHIRIECNTEDHPDTCINVLPPYMSWNITIANSGYSLKSPVICILVLSKPAVIDKVSLPDPAEIIKIIALINKEPKACNKVRHEEKWCKHENNLPSLISYFKWLGNSSKLWHFQNSSKLKQSEYSQKTIQPWNTGQPQELIWALAWLSILIDLL